MAPPLVCSASLEEAPRPCPLRPTTGASCPHAVSRFGAHTPLQSIFSPGGRVAPARLGGSAKASSRPACDWPVFQNTANRPPGRSTSAALAAPATGSPNANSRPKSHRVDAAACSLPGFEGRHFDLHSARPANWPAERQADTEHLATGRLAAAQQCQLQLRRERVRQGPQPQCARSGQGIARPLRDPTRVRRLPLVMRLVLRLRPRTSRITSGKRRNRSGRIPSVMTGRGRAIPTS